jgi:hypothetical protein
MYSSRGVLMTGKLTGFVANEKTFLMAQLEVSDSL